MTCGVDVLQELGRDGEAGGIGKGFAFQQLSMDGQQWQPAFLTSIDHRPSVTNETPTFSVSASALEADKAGPLLEEDTTTPLSEVSPRTLQTAHVSLNVQRLFEFFQNRFSKGLSSAFTVLRFEQGSICSHAWAAGFHGVGNL
jgi:hypothetical protein